jgi:hypothetical protein
MASHGREVFREHTTRCLSALEVGGVGLARYKVFPMVLGLGTLVSGSDDVP